MSRSRSYPIVVISLFVLAAFAARALSLEAQSLWRDEVDALRFATGPLSEILSRFTQTGWNGPLYFMLLRGWVGLTGTSEYAMRFFSLFFGVLCVPLVYALGRRLFSRPAGFLGALLMTASPYLIWYSVEVKMYTLVPALALLAIYALRRASAGGGWYWWGVQVFATSFAFYSHVLAALLISIEILLGLVWWPWARKQWIGGLASLAALTLPYLPLLVWQWPLLFTARETGFHPYSLAQMALILFNGWSLGVLPLRQPWGVILKAVVGAMAVWGLVSSLFSPSFFPSRAAGKNRTLRNSLVLLIWLLTPLLAVGVISRWQPLFTDRYLVWGAPAFYLLIALGLAFFLQFKAWGPWVTMLLAGVIIVFDSVSAWQQVITPIKSDFRAAAAHVSNYREEDEQAAPGISYGDLAFKTYLPFASSAGYPSVRAGELFVFQIPYGRYTFDYYFPHHGYAWADGYYTNHRAAGGSFSVTEQENAQYMEEMVAGHGAVWLVATETAMWDERGLAQAWLESNAQRVDEAHFTRVDVYRYVLEQSP